MGGRRRPVADDLKLAGERRMGRADRRQLYVTLETVQHTRIARRVLKSRRNFTPDILMHIHKSTGENREHRSKMLMQTRAR